MNDVSVSVRCSPTIGQEQPESECDEDDCERYPDVSRIEFDDVEDPEQ